MTYIRVKDNDSLVRDLNSNGIINVDENSYHQYVENYKNTYNSKQKIKDLENDVNEIKGDLNEIKNLLRSLINESK